MAAGIPSELAVIAFTMGSSPGKRGDAMLIAQNGEQAGTVGGGLLEFESTKLCLEYINEKKSLVRTFELDSEKAGAIGMICGGQDTLLYQYLDPEDTQKRPGSSARTSGSGCCSQIPRLTRAVSEL